MLDQNQLTELFIKQKIPLNGRKVVENIRTSEPVRRVGGGTYNVVTRFASRKMGCVIQAESHKAELPLIYLMENDLNTLEFYDQPSQIKLSYIGRNGKRVTHNSTPDFFAIQRGRMGWIEVKREEELLEYHASGSERFIPDGNGGWRCPAGEAYAAKYGLGFWVHSAKDTNHIQVRNYEFLSDFVGDESLQPTQKSLTAINGVFEKERWVLLQQMLDLDDVTADDIYIMIAQDKLCFDIESELLSEPQYTNICADSLSLEVYKQQKTTSNDVSLTQLQSIVVDSGTEISWDGKPWKIANVGSNDIYLEGEDKNVLSVKFDSFQALVSNGSITGIQIEPDERASLAAEIFKHAAPADLQAAVKRLACLDDPSLAVSIRPRTLRDWRRKALNGELAYGSRLAGLVTGTAARGNRNRKLDPQVIKLMYKVFDTEYLSKNQTEIKICYGTLYNLCEKDGLEPPSKKTFKEEINSLMKDAVTLARQGRKAAYSYSEFIWIINQSTPRHGERPFEVGHIDHTQIDLQGVHSRTGAELGKPWLTILFDANTRVVLAFYLTYDAPSYRSCMAVIRNAIQRHGRIPKTIVVDNGKDFESEYFEVLLARLESHKKSRPKSKSRFGSVIERFFGVANKAFVHNLKGNNKALQEPRSMSPSHDPRSLAVWTLPAFTSAFEQFIDGYYNTATHPTLGVSPKEFMARGLMQSGERKHKLFTDTEDFRLLSMPTTKKGTAKVNSSRGIRINGIFYWTPAFRDPLVVGKNIPIRYDPFDVSRAYALVNGEWVLCRSEYQAAFERRSEKEIVTISQEIRMLHILAEKNRDVRAAEKAAFISQMRETEAVLKQQLRDAEQKASESPESDQSTEDEPHQHIEPKEDRWSDSGDFGTFGELQ